MPKKSRWSLGRLLWRGVLGLLALGVLLAAVVYMWAIRPDRQSVPYRQAMERLQANSSATRLLGAPVEAGWWVRGHASADSARLTVPVSGRARSGVLRVEGRRAGDGWVFSRLTLTVDDNGVRLSLLPDGEQRGSSAPPMEVPPRYQE